MPHPFESILKYPLRVEHYVSSSESASIVSSTFIGAGLMFLAMLITWLFIWSYQKDRYLFISMVALVAFAYGTEMVILSAVNMSDLTVTQFRLFMGSSLLFSLMFMLVSIFGFVKYKHRNSSPSSYVPSNVESYLK